MRAGLAISLAASLGAHLVVTAAFLAPSLARRSLAEDPPPQLAGETFELPAPDTPEPPLSSASPAPEAVSNVAASEEGDAPAPRVIAPPIHGRPAPRASHAKRPSAGRADPGHDDAPSSSGSAALYGAIGERSASDLATSFTRGLPQAASGDPAWAVAPLGSAGEADIVLTLDGDGHIEGSQILGAPSPALTSAIRRTLTLIKGRPFTARGRTTKLHLVAAVSPDAVHDGLHGDVFAIGGSFAGGEGSAFFALAIGRRIDIRVRATSPH